VTQWGLSAGSHGDPGRADRAGYPTLHLLRLLAAICIFAGHWSEPFFTAAIPQGQLAIDMFFMVEGFLAARLLAGEQHPGRTGALILARLGHVYPIYLGGLLAGFAAVAPLATAGAGGWTTVFWLRSLAAGAALLPVHTPLAHGSVYPLNPPSWAIILELFGFAALALVRQRSPRFGPALLWLAGTVLLLALAALWHDPNMGWRAERYWGGLPRMAFGFFGGALLYALHVRAQLGPRPGWAAPVLLCLAFVAMQFLTLWLIAWPLLGIVTPLLVLAAANLAVPGWLARLAVWAGRHALAVYLLGYGVMMGWRVAGPAFGLPPAFAGSPIGFALVLGTLLLAAAIWVGIGRYAGQTSRSGSFVRTALSTS
jgi:peptidoglycan/LPS O-acetylase OafA/YrhL